jgi:hypothetical protein
MKYNNLVNIKLNNYYDFADNEYIYSNRDVMMKSVFSEALEDEKNKDIMLDLMFDKNENFFDKVRDEIFNKKEIPDLLNILTCNENINFEVYIDDFTFVDGYKIMDILPNTNNITYSFNNYFINPMKIKLLPKKINNISVISKEHNINYLDKTFSGVKFIEILQMHCIHSFHMTYLSNIKINTLKLYYYHGISNIYELKNCNIQKLVILRLNLLFIFDSRNINLLNSINDVTINCSDIYCPQGLIYDEFLIDNFKSKLPDAKFI